MPRTNSLYYGDNLDVLRKHIADNSVDLIYLDPPFNSSRSYNVLFKESSGSGSEAQIEAFEDTWEWGDGAARAYHEVLTGKHQEVARILHAMVDGLGLNPVTAYLSMMAIRLLELHRVLAPTGSIYLHCDPTASHYLKLLMDSVFGPKQFRNEFVWKRSTAHSDSKQGSKQAGRVHDIVFFYSKGDSWTWNTVYTAYDEEYLAPKYRYIEIGTGRRYRKGDLTAAKPGGDTAYEWRVKRPSAGDEWDTDLDEEWSKPKDGWEYKAVKPYANRYWAYSRENMARYAREGRLVHTSTGMPEYKRYLDEMAGVPLQDVWTDLDPINSQAAERLGYPTQKPLSLLERIIQASSNPGDTVLDPFCGCGTAVHAAHKLGRRWIGIDITYLAVGLVRRRLENAFPGLAIQVTGEPVDLASARDLAQRDKFQFQWWAVERLDALPVAGRKKKGADQGIDGVIPIVIGGSAARPEYARVIVSVKGGGNVGVLAMRDLRGVIEREQAPMGVLLTLEPPTRAMVTEAAAAGVFHSAFYQRDYPRLQILTIAEVLAGKRPNIPPVTQVFAQAPAERVSGTQLTF